MHACVCRLLMVVLSMCVAGRIRSFCAWCADSPDGGIWCRQDHTHGCAGRPQDRYVQLCLLDYTELLPAACYAAQALPVSLPMCLPVCLRLSICLLSDVIFVCLSVRLCVCVSVVCLSVCLAVQYSQFVSACMSRFFESAAFDATSWHAVQGAASPANNTSMGRQKQKQHWLV